MSIKWTNHKERSFASNYFIFLEILVQFKNLLKRIDLMYQLPKCPSYSKALCTELWYECTQLDIWLSDMKETKGQN